MGSRAKVVVPVVYEEDKCPDGPFEKADQMDELLNKVLAART